MTNSYEAGRSLHRVEIPADLQELFKIIAVGLLKQGKKSVLGPDHARYPRLRGFDGCKCSMGFLIPDDKYREFMECDILSWILPLEDYNPNEGIYITPRCKLLDSLRSIHDYSEPSEWYENLEQVAKVYDLDDSCIKEFAPDGSVQSTV